MDQANTEKMQALIKGCRKKSRKSQKLLYKEFYAYGMSICIRYVNNRDEAAEILNDGFMKVFDNIDKFDIDKPFKPWLRRILVNTSINHYKKNQKYSKQDPLENVQLEGEEGEILSGIAYHEIIEIIQKLSPQYRTVFNLYVIEGYKHEEIAEILGISAGTSKSNLAKAKRNLQVLLNRFFFNEKHVQQV